MTERERMDRCCELVHKGMTTTTPYEVVPIVYALRETEGVRGRDWDTTYVVLGALAEIKEQAS